MFATINKPEITLTTCEYLGKAVAERSSSINVIGKFICHTGTQVWVELAGCGQSDSHQFNHVHSSPDYINKMYKGKLVRIEGRRFWSYTECVWKYMWTIHTVNGTNC